MGDIDDEDLDLLDFLSNDQDDSPPSSHHHARRDEANAQPSPRTAPNQQAPQKQRQQLPLRRPASNSTQQQQQQQHNPPGASNEQPSSHQGPASPAPKKKTGSTPAADFTETFSGLRVRNRLLSAEDMRVRMKGRKVHRLARLSSVPTRALESQEPSDAWAVLGVLVSKSPRRQAANGGSYSIWTLSDLSRKENDVSVFLFQEALSSHWTTCLGTLVAVMSAKVLPPKEDGGGGGGGNAQKLAFSVDSPWQMSKVGMSMDYALCKGTRKDGKSCTMPVNKAEGGGYCEFHVVAAFNRAQRQNPLKNKANAGNSNNNNNNRNNGSNGSTISARMNENSFQAIKATISMAKVLGRPQPTAAPRGPAASLSGIVGAGARRREDIGTARFGTAAAKIIPPSRDAKILRPSDSRAAGRTTNLSSITSAARVGKAAAAATLSAQPRKQPSGGPTGAGGSKVVTGSGKGGRLSGGGGGGGSGGGGSCDGESGGSKPSSSPVGNGEDLLGLPWAYGGGGGDSGGGGGGGGRSKPSAKGTLEPKAGLGKGRANGSANRGASGSRGGGGGGGGDSGGGPRVAVAAEPPKRAHPAGYVDGTVVVPAQSNVFLTMPQRFAVRADGSRTKEGEQKMAHVQMLMAQRALKQKADCQGLLLRPQDPNVAAPGKRSSAILGAGSKRARSGVAGAGAIRGAGKGGDPLTKKVKTLSAVEKELLLRRVSKYAGLAEEERAKEADRGLQRLEQREAMADKAEEVTKMAVTVFHCMECKSKRSRFSKRCRDLGHTQKGVKATLRFFECTNCRRRRPSTDRVPQTGCEGCGKHNAWKRCGARPGRGPADSARDKRFVAAMSEWTDQRDLSLAAPDFR